jgi:uncharacterized protein YcbX
MAVAGLWRYPVKSMLGEELAEAVLDHGGVVGDRAFAVLDVETGRVATAKYARLWRSLLRFRARQAGPAVRITLPDGRGIDAADGDAHRVLSAALGRPVSLAGARSAGAAMDRPAAEAVLEHGVTADLPVSPLVLAQGSPGGSFVDYASVHLISTATLAGIGAEALRFRPNILLATDGPAYAENAWVGRELRIGEVRLRITLPTPRCVLPTLEHGELPRAQHALRGPAAANRVPVPGFGVLPCAGVYAEVLAPGRIRLGEVGTLS